MLILKIHFAETKVIGHIIKLNKGFGGVNAINVEKLLQYLHKHGIELKQQILDGKYKCNLARLVEIPEHSDIVPIF